jgi:hypothetical protein
MPLLLQQTARKSTGGQNIVKKLASQKGLKQRARAAKKPSAAGPRPAATQTKHRRKRSQPRGIKALQ